MQTTRLYHGTNRNPYDVADSPEARKATNGHGFFLTDNMDIAKSYGKFVIEYVIPTPSVSIAKSNKLKLGALEGLEYVCTQAEINDIVLYTAEDIIIH
jgi:hypothetical protein